MNCKHHKNEVAKFICDKCKMPICEECSTEIGGNKICKSCIEKSIYSSDNTRPRRSFFERVFFFLLSLIPGAAHMYMGLIKKGFQLMVAFIAVIVVFSYVNTEAFIPVIVIPTWFFSFFDSYSCRKKLINGIEIEDSEIIEYRWFYEHRKYIGIGMLILGLIGFINAMQYSFMQRIFGIDFRDFYWSIRRSILPLMMIFAGLVVLTKNRNNEDEVV